MFPFPSSKFSIPFREYRLLISIFFSICLYFLSENKEKTDGNASEMREEKTDISRLFGTKQKYIYRCLKCNEEKVKTNILLVCNLLLSGSNRDIEFVTFNQVLRSSLSVEKTTPAFCETCKKFTPTNQYARITDLPQILSINCGLTNEKEIGILKKQMNRSDSSTPQPAPTTSTPIKPCRYGANCTRVDCHFAHADRKSPQTSTSNGANHSTSLNVTNTSTSSNRSSPWFPLQFTMEVDSESGDLIVEDVNLNESESVTAEIEASVTETSTDDVENVTESLKNLSTENETEDETKDLQQKKPNTKKLYKLTSVVCQIINGTQKNLVSLIYVSGQYHKMKLGDQNTCIGQWYIFNDFSIAPVSMQEAVWFTLDWKVPCVLFYSSEDVCNFDVKLPNPVNENNPFLHVS